MILSQMSSINELFLGCMESIVRYKRLILRKHSGSLSGKEVDDLLLQCSELLGKLEHVDALRRRRYQQLSALLLALRSLTINVFHRAGASRIVYCIHSTNVTQGKVYKQFSNLISLQHCTRRMIRDPHILH